MTYRQDTILSDMTSEGHGGSAYHNFNVPFTVVNGNDISMWIAPRTVRIIDAKWVSLLSRTDDLTATRYIGATSSGNAFTDNDDLTARVVKTAPLDTGSTSGLDNVVVPGGNHLEITIGTLGGANHSVTVQAHYAFEDD